MMLGPNVPNPVTFLGMYIAYFTAPLEQQHGEDYKSTIYIAPNKRMMFTRRHRADQIQIYVMSTMPSMRM